MLHEESKTWINMADNLVLLRTRPEFLWTSESKSGFRHLYRYSNSGEELAQLTSGGWEVKSIEESPASASPLRGIREGEEI